MKRIISKPLCSLLAFFIFFLCSDAALAELQHNGTSSFSKFNKEYFIGSLFLDKKSSDHNEIYDNSQQRRMEMIINVSKFSPRKFSELWTTGISVNNSNELIEKNLASIRAFADSIKDDLTNGDIVKIEYSPLDGTSIAVNDIILEKAMSHQLFNLLLSSWIGQVPLSTNFKEAILSGDDTSQLMALKATQDTSIERAAEIRSWLVADIKQTTKDEVGTTGTTKVLEVASTVSSTLTQEEATKRSASKVHVAKAPTVAKKREKPVIAAVDTGLLAPPPMIAATPKVIQALEAKRAKAPSKSVAKGALTPKNTQESVLATANTFKTIVATRNRVKGNEYLQRYIPELQKWIEEKAPYPLVVTGKPNSKSVKFDILIDRNGEVKDVQQRGSRLNSFAYTEAIEIIKNASPFPEIPNTVETDLLKFNLYFHLHSRETNGELGTYSSL